MRSRGSTADVRSKCSTKSSCRGSRAKKVAEMLALRQTDDADRCAGMTPIDSRVGQCSLSFGFAQVEKNIRDAARMDLCAHRCFSSERDRSRSSRTSSSEVCEKSRYHAPTAKKGSAVSAHTTTSTSLQKSSHISTTATEPRRRFPLGSACAAQVPQRASSIPWQARRRSKWRCGPQWFALRGRRDRSAHAA